MARLIDSFSALFALGLGLDAAYAGHASQAAQKTRPGDLDTLTPERAQQQARTLIAAARARARAAGAPTQHIELASFAIVAWLDEIMARSPQWTGDMPTLQMQLFNSGNAHTEFFHHLSALTAEDAEVREVYWYALIHGYKGQYYFETGNEGELGKLKALHGQQLPVRPLDLGALARERLTPQPYAMPDAPGPRRPQQRARALVRLGAAVALLIPAALLLWLAWVGSPGRAPTTAQRIEQRLRTYTCADLSVMAEVDGPLRIEGFVASLDDLARVQADVMAIVETAAPQVQQTGAVPRAAPVFSMQLRAWPHCEAAAILKPFRTRNVVRLHGLRLRAPTAHEGRLREGDVVRLEVTGPTHGSAYLWVDYYTQDGAVLHLNANRAALRVDAGQTVELGGDVPSSWLVSPPFGTVLVSVLASPVPFMDADERPPFELASAYLLRLREALAAHAGDDRLIADFIFLETVAR